MDSVHHLRLLQLASSTLPVGAFTYSQGLETAVEFGWVTCTDSLAGWISSTLDLGVTPVDIPLFKRLYKAYADDKPAMGQEWIERLLACRETRELRDEELQRGRAFARLLPELEPTIDSDQQTRLSQSQLAGQAWLCAHWKIDPMKAMETLVWSWMENLVLAGVKLIPLGQSDGQRLILSLGERIPSAVVEGFNLSDDSIGAGCQATALASSLHETQYTRLFRS
jgi:urease accessory protein